MWLTATKIIFVIFAKKRRLAKFAKNGRAADMTVCQDSFLLTVNSLKAKKKTPGPFSNILPL